MADWFTANAPGAAPAAAAPAGPPPPAGNWFAANAPEATTEAPEGKSVGGFLSNAVDSGYNLAKGTVEGAALVGKLANAVSHGGVELVTDPQLRGMMQGAHTAGVGGIARGAKEYFSKRYGGLNEIGETAYTDPFGLAADAATVASLGGGAAARAPGVVGRIGRGVAAVGSAIDPMAAAGRVAGAVAPAAGKVAERVGEGLNASALQISSKLKSANPGINIPRAMAEEGIIASRRGRDTLKGLTTADDAEIGALIGGSTKTGSAEDVTRPLRELADEKRALMPGSSLAGESGSVDARVAGIMGPADEGVQLSGDQSLILDPADLEQRFPRASDVVDGRKVRPGVPNEGSIEASFGDDYHTLEGVREFPMEAMGGDPNYKPKPYSVAEAKRLDKLTAEIGASGEISPLIVALDASGTPYVVEGGHRFDALVNLGAKSFPARVVVDTSQVALGAKAVPRTFPVQQLQRTKVALNERLAQSFGTAAAEPLAMQIQQAERKGLMSAIEAAEPGVAPINQRLGRRYAIGDAIDELRARPSAVTPADLLKGGIGSGIGAAVGGGIPGAVVGGAATMALKSPLVKSLLARELFRASRAAPGAARTFEASGPMLTRLALLARLQGDPPPE